MSRDQRRKSCKLAESGGPCPQTGKLKYRRRTALAVARRIQRRRSLSLRPYPCPHCGSWHLTKMSARDYAESQRRNHDRASTAWRRKDEADEGKVSRPSRRRPVEGDDEE